MLRHFQLLPGSYSYGLGFEDTSHLLEIAFFVLCRCHSVIVAMAQLRTEEHRCVLQNRLAVRRWTYFSNAIFHVHLAYTRMSKGWLSFQGKHDKPQA